MSTYEDEVLAGAHNGTDPTHAALAIARCTRLLDGDALADVLAALGLGVAE